MADHNLVTILMTKFSTTVQESMNQCVAIHQHIVDKFLAIRDGLALLMSDDTLWDAITRQKVAHYIDGLAGTVRGCDMWSSESVRYGLSRDFAKTRCIKVRPPKSL